MNTMSILNAIAHGEVDDDLDRIYRELVDRRKIVKTRQATALVRALRVGDRVEVIGGIKPRYIVGAQGTVRGKLQTKIEVELDEAVGRFGKRVRIPATCLRKLEVETEDD